jgi:protoheme IX farnesyltransferase
MAPETVLLFGVGCSIAGLWHLAVTVNRLTCLIGAVTLLSYVLVYTPLKRRTWLNTLVGAVPGGLPPLMGWTAARGEAGAGGWGLFAILFFWQLAHFLAIAWIYRDEYERAGFVMLPSVDPDGSRTARQAVGHTAALLAVSLGPVALGLAGGVYAAGAVVLGLFFLAAAAAFARRLDAGRARRLFLASVLYLPLLLGLMVFDKLAP